MFDKILLVVGECSFLEGSLLFWEEYNVVFILYVWFV